MSRKDRIIKQVIQALNPKFLELEDETRKHHVPKEGETHFKLTLVCDQFIDYSRIMRHRLVNQLLKEEFSKGLHALSLHLYTPKEWEVAGKSVLKSPACKDGFDKN